MRAIVIGAGFAGISVASLLRKEGWDVTLVEKNKEIGGRARLWKEKGYSFDMGPSWYLMPEVFERYFNLLGKKSENYYNLKKLDPQYKIFYENEASVLVTADIEKTYQLFEQFEVGGAKNLQAFLKSAEYKYKTAMNEFVYKNYTNLFQFFNQKILTEGLKLDLFSSLEKHLSKFFKNHRSKKILEYTMVFLGTSPDEAPALYSIMSHVDLNLGVYFPKGGLNGVAQGMVRLYQELGGNLRLDTDVTSIVVKNNRAVGVMAGGEFIEADLVVNSGDYHWGETQLLAPEYQSYPEGYWKSRIMAPSMFILYVGVNKKLNDLEHHNLYFAQNWGEHFDQIFKNIAWPENPSYYMSAITKTDESMAPPGCENIFILVPVASGLKDSDDFKKRYAEKILDHVEKTSGVKLKENIEVLRIYGPSDFEKDYHAYQGTALGLAHTLFQTAVFRPKIRSRKLPNLYYTGQFTHPGVGVPMTLISAELVAEDIKKRWTRKK